MQRTALLQALQASKSWQAGAKPPRGLQLLYSGLPGSCESNLSEDRLVVQSPNRLPGYSLTSAAFHSSASEARLQGGEDIALCGSC